MNKSTSITTKTYKRYALFHLIGWTILVVIYALYHAKDENNLAVDLATIEARTSFKKDLAFRQWSASHGGVYVTATEKTKPNPYLSHIEHRDIIPFQNKNLKVG